MVNLQQCVVISSLRGNGMVRGVKCAVVVCRAWESRGGSAQTVYTEAAAYGKRNGYVMAVVVLRAVRQTAVPYPALCGEARV